MPFLPPNQQRQSTEGQYISTHEMHLIYNSYIKKVLIFFYFTYYKLQYCIPTSWPREAQTAQTPQISSINFLQAGCSFTASHVNHWRQTTVNANCQQEITGYYSIAGTRIEINQPSAGTYYFAVSPARFFKWNFQVLWAMSRSVNC